MDLLAEALFRDLIEMLLLDADRVDMLRKESIEALLKATAGPLSAALEDAISVLGGLVGDRLDAIRDGLVEALDRGGMGGASHCRECHLILDPVPSFFC